MFSNSPYFDENKNKNILEKVASKCYIPTNKILLDLIDQYKKKFKIAFSLTGVFIEQCQKYAPHVIESFKQLANTGNVEFLSETYYHSLSALFSQKEFEEQINLHKNLINDLFNQKPEVFRNTEAMYSNSIAKSIENLGYKGIITEGHEKVLSWRSPNYLYKSVGCEKIVSLLRTISLATI
jgi:alpha-amylase